MKDIPRSPFPGMDPYLEQPDLWPDVHNRLITMMANSLAPQVRPRYYVAVEERVYTIVPGSLLVGRPDVAVIDRPGESQWPRVDEATVPYQPILIDLPTPTFEEIREPYLEVREVAGHRVITVIELLSPSNKLRGGQGYAHYLRKRLDILRSQTHLVEIDLLRGEQPLPMEGNPPASDYRIIVSRRQQRPKAHLYAFNLPQAIPIFSIPLHDEAENEPDLNLQELLHRLYEQAGYDLRIDYRADPVPLLKPPDSIWTDNLLRQAGLR